MLSAGLQLPLDASASDNSNILTEDDFVKKDSILRNVADLSDFDSAEYIKRRDAIELEKNDKGELLTPGGKVSNIQNETLWRTVRTDEFKEWFGDWQSNELRKTLEGFSNIKVSSSIAPTQGKTKDIVEWSKKVLPNSVTNKTLGEVIINAQTIKASLAHGYGKSKIQSILAIPQIIEKGILVHSEINTESKRFQGEMFVLAHPVKIDGDTFQAFVLIRKDINSSRLYVHEVVEIQKLQMLSKTGAKAKKQPHIRASRVIRSIAERLYLNQENVSKVVDENGEPLVVFRGSNETIDDSKSSDFYFTDEPKLADDYASRQGSNIVPTFLSLPNPAIINANGRFINSNSENDIVVSLPEDYKGTIIKNIIDTPNRMGLSNSHLYPVTTFRVAEKEQIKSIFNRGSYSNNEDSILRKIADTESRQFFKDLQYYTLDQKLPFITGGTLKDGEIEISEAEAVTIGQILGGDMFFGLFLPPQFASETVGSLNRLADDAMQAGYLIRLFGMA